MFASQTLSPNKARLAPGGQRILASDPFYLVSSQVTIPNVPAYNWYRGCGPTSVGMVLGYWNTHGYPGLIGGNSTYQNESVDSAVASPEHYQDYSLPIDYAPNLLPDKSTLGGAHPSNSIADFMNTSWSSRYNYYGWSWFGDVGPSWVQYVSWKRPEYVATSKDHIFNAGAWNAYKEQIDQGKPVVLLVDSDGDGVSDHFVTGIGYDEVDSTYGVHDTWDVSTHWYPWIRMTAGIPWGVLGFTSFDISRNTTIVTLLAPQDGSVLGGVSIGFTWHPWQGQWSIGSRYLRNIWFHRSVLRCECRNGYGGHRQ